MPSRSGHQSGVVDELSRVGPGLTGSLRPRQRDLVVLIRHLRDSSSCHFISSFVNLERAAPTVLDVIELHNWLGEHPTHRQK